MGTARAVPSAKSPANSATRSSFPRKVFLHDWWLVRVEIDSKGTGLGIGGFAPGVTHALREFRSAAVARRHDTVSLETVDGITVTISGLINRSRTLQNGFPSEVCNHFLLGFPYDWDECASRSFVERSFRTAIPSRVSSLDRLAMSSDDGTYGSLPISFDSFPVTHLRDLLMVSHGDAENCALSKSILNDILEKYGGTTLKHDGTSVPSEVHRECPKTTMDSELNETPSNLEKIMSKQKRKHDDGSNVLMTRRSVHDGTPTNHGKTKIGENSKHGGTSVPSEFDRECPTTTMDSELNEPPSNPEKIMAKQKRKHDDGTDVLMTRRSVHDGTPTNHGETKIGENSKDGGTSVPSEIHSECPMTTMDSELNEPPSNSEKIMGKQKRKYDDGINVLMSQCSVHDGTPTNHCETKIGQNGKDGDGIIHAADMGTVVSKKTIPGTKIDMDVNSSRSRVTTRSMSRLNNLRNKPEKFKKQARDYSFAKQLCDA